MKPRHRLVSATRRLWPTVMTIMNVILLIVVSSTSLLARVGKPDGPGIIGKARRGWEWGSAWGYWAWADLRPIRLSRFLLPPLTTRRSIPRKLSYGWDSSAVSSSYIAVEGFTTKDLAIWRRGGGRLNCRSEKRIWRN
jgi:hypothetical protein